MVTKFMSGNVSSYNFTEPQAYAKKAMDKEVHNPKKPEVRDDFLLKQSIDKLSEKLQSTFMYTKEASKIVAENMLARKVEVVA